MKHLGKLLVTGTTALAVILGACLPFGITRLQNHFLTTQEDVREIGIEKMEMKYPSNPYVLHEQFNRSGGRYLIPLKQGYKMTEEEAVATAKMTIQRMQEFGIFPEITLEDPLKVKPKLMVSMDGKGLTDVIWEIIWMDTNEGDDYNFTTEISEAAGKLSGLWYSKANSSQNNENRITITKELREKWETFCCSYYESGSCIYDEESQKLLMADKDNPDESIRISLGLWKDCIIFGFL